MSVCRTAERSQRRNPRDAAWEKEEKRRKQRKERIKHGKKVVEKEAAARLRVYGDTLASLQIAYMDEHGQKRPESLIEMPDWEKEERELLEDEQERAKDIPTNDIPNPSPARESGIQRAEILPPSSTSEHQGADAGHRQSAHTATVHDPHAQKHDASNEL